MKKVWWWLCTVLIGQQPLSAFVVLLDSNCRPLSVIWITAGISLLAWGYLLPERFASKPR